MSSPLQKAFKKHLGKDLFEVKRRPRGVGRIAGFIVAMSESLILFHQLDWDTFCLNGYSVICSDDVSVYRAFDRNKYWQHRAAQLRKLNPIIPDGVSAAGWQKLFESVASRFPLVVIHTERKHPDICYVGEGLRVSDTTVTLYDLDCNCEWQKPRRFRFADITMVEFGDGYSTALAATAPKRKALQGRP